MTPKRPTVAVLQEALQQRDDTLELFQERLAELELALEDAGWWRMVANEQEFSRDSLRQISQLSRIMAIKNPLVKRGLTVQGHYVWGQGMMVRAVADAVNDVVKAFFEDPKNQVELTGEQARLDKDRELATDGNLFFVFFVHPSTGRVRLRTIPLVQVDEIICNPEDAKEPWYYKRSWTEQVLDMATGTQTPKQRTAYYPDWQYRPAKRVQTIGGHSVHWSTPVYHVKTGGFSDWKFGLSEVYASIDWARAYKEFLEDWASITRAYSRFAWKQKTTGGRQGVQAARNRIGTTLANGGARETNPPPGVGSVWIGAEGQDLEPIKTAGAAVKAEDGRRMLLMVAAALNLPETFFGDVSVGTLATATSLDRPTELAMKSRQTLWGSIFGNILGFVLFCAVKAINGPLRGLGTVMIDPVTRDETVTWTNPDDAHLDIDFPPLVAANVKERMEAIGLGAPHIPDYELLGRLVLTTLGEDDIDEVLAAMFEEDGTPKRPPASMAPAPPQGDGAGTSGQGQQGATQPRRQKQASSGPQPEDT